MKNIGAGLIIGILGFWIFQNFQYFEIKNFQEEISGFFSEISQKKSAEQTQKTETPVFKVSPENLEKQCLQNNISPYLNPKETAEQWKKNLENENFPKMIFVQNPSNRTKYSAAEIQKFSQKIRETYLQKKRPTPIIFIDNEGGTVQRVSKYPEISEKNESHTSFEIQKFLSKKEMIAFQKGEISIREREKKAEKTKTPTLLLQAYAKARIAQERALGLNTVTLILDHGEKSGVIKTRGWRNRNLKKMYANILIQEAEISGMQVLIKHFPGHLGVRDPHINPVGTKKKFDFEIEDFLEILRKNKKRKNITIMLGHIKSEVPDWESFAKKSEISQEKIYEESAGENKKYVPASQSQHIAQKLWEINPDFLLITDDIAAMQASGNPEISRKNAKSAGISALN